MLLTNEDVKALLSIRRDDRKLTPAARTTLLKISEMAAKPRQPKPSTELGELPHKPSDAAFLAVKILEPFKESSLYDHYRDDEDDPFTDDEFDTMLETLKTLAD